MFYNLFLAACGKIRAATGKAMLLVNKKFKQFRGLCNMNLVSVCRNIVRILNLSSFLRNMPENMQTVRMFF